MRLIKLDERAPYEHMTLTIIDIPQLGGQHKSTIGAGIGPIDTNGVNRT